ncbi:hypothetical protein Ciccas_004437 [Cichlidogyrus casuarinus]|uniref:Uncharacterized protein n=1 Tax=Cichlidogyrus casuarinus TaxID=1844966 RepID=A0ABD2QF07_9PLAT
MQTEEKSKRAVSIPGKENPGFEHKNVKIASNFVLEGQKINILGVKYQLPELDEIVLQRQALVEEKWLEILKGRCESVELPGRPFLEQRIFIASTFSDFKLERQWFMLKVLPRMKEFCAKLNPFSLYGLQHADTKCSTKEPIHWPGLDLRICDTRWGMVDSAVDNHIVEKICKEEIDTCAKQSLGAFFVAFLGNRYGYRAVAPEIPSEYFRLLRKIAFRVARNTAPLLDTWYKEDTNGLEPMFILQPISSCIDGYKECLIDTCKKTGSVSTTKNGFLAVPLQPHEEHNLRRKAGHQWFCEAEALRSTIRKASQWILDYLAGNVRGDDYVLQVLSPTDLQQLAQSPTTAKWYWTSLTKSATELELLHAIYADSDAESITRRELGLSPKSDEISRGKRCFVYDRQLVG